jgi:hypothetical protein
VRENKRRVVVGIVLQLKPIFVMSLIYIEKSNGSITEPSVTPMSSDKSVDFILYNETNCFLSVE